MIALVRLTPKVVIPYTVVSDITCPLYSYQQCISKKIILKFSLNKVAVIKPSQNCHQTLILADQNNTLIKILVCLKWIKKY